MRLPELKILMNIPAADTSQDDYLNGMLPLMLEWVKDYCLTDFKGDKIDDCVFDPDNTITADGAAHNVDDDDIIMFDSSIAEISSNRWYYVVNAGVADTFQVSTMLDGDAVTFDGDIDNEGVYYRVTFPGGVKIAVAKAIEYISVNLALQSESLGDYKVVYSLATNWNDFPPHVRNLLRPYRRHVI